MMLRGQLKVHPVLYIGGDQTSKPVGAETDHFSKPDPLRNEGKSFG